MLGRASSSAARAARSTSSSAPPRPIAPVSAVVTCSASSRPPVRSRFARMRSGSTSSPSRQSRSHAAADPVATSSARSGAHSACHAPAARWCSCSIEASSVAASPGACRAAPSAQTAATGLCLCGIVDDPPPRPSRTSPTSVWLSRTTSRATLARAPHVCASAPASAATRARSVCHGSAGAGRSSCAAIASRTAMPRLPSDARLPAAPPSCTARRSRRTTSSRSDAASSAIIQPAATRPNVVGTACWSSVRPAIGVARCTRASAAAANAAPSTSAVSATSARRATSIIAVSITSWLVAPRCTWPRPGSSTRAVSAATSGPAGLPIDGACAPIAAGS